MESCGEGSVCWRAASGYLPDCIFKITIQSMIWKARRRNCLNVFLRELCEKTGCLSVLSEISKAMAAGGDAV